MYDTALRGVYQQAILRDLGLLPIKRVAAAKAGWKNARRDPRERRSEKLGFAETKTVTLSDGTTKNIDLYASGGAPERRRRRTGRERRLGSPTSEPQIQLPTSASSASWHTPDVEISAARPSANNFSGP